MTIFLFNCRCELRVKRVNWNVPEDLQVISLHNRFRFHISICGRYRLNNAKLLQYCKIQTFKYIIMTIEVFCLGKSWTTSFFLLFFRSFSLPLSLFLSLSLSFFFLSCFLSFFLPFSLFFFIFFFHYCIWKFYKTFDRNYTFLFFIDFCPAGKTFDKFLLLYLDSISGNGKNVRRKTFANIFQLTSTVSDYHEKFLFMYISEDDSEMIHHSMASSFRNVLSSHKENTVKIKLH